jgi:hypothetical protein
MRRKSRGKKNGNKQTQVEGNENMSLNRSCHKLEAFDNNEI